MAKGKTTKKKNMKLRRQLRKTLGCLFMISALIVTAIPVTPTEAAGAGWNPATLADCWLKSESTVIPNIADDAPVYQDETSNFRFVYVDSNGQWDAGSDKNKIAIIVDYNRDQDLPGGNLTITSKVDAYVKFTDSGSTGTYAANKDGKPLYYKKMEQVTTTTPGTPELTSEDLNGDGIFNDYTSSVITKATQGFVAFEPCLQAQKDAWSPGGEDVQLYYYNSADGIPPAQALWMMNMRLAELLCGKR